MKIKCCIWKKKCAKSYIHISYFFLTAIYSNPSSKSQRIVSIVCLFAEVPSPKLRATSIKKTTIFQTLLRYTNNDSVQRTAQIYNFVSVAHEWSLHSCWRRYVSRMSWRNTHERFRFSLFLIRPLCHYFFLRSLFRDHLFRSTGCQPWEFRNRRIAISMRRGLF